MLCLKFFLEIVGFIGFQAVIIFLFFFFIGQAVIFFVITPEVRGCFLVLFSVLSPPSFSFFFFFSLSFFF